MAIAQSLAYQSGGITFRPANNKGREVATFRLVGKGRFVLLVNPSDKPFALKDRTELAVEQFASLENPTQAEG